MTTKSEKFYLIGHRGAAGERLENSPEGFQHALTLAIDAVEIDIREHSGEIWVFHDRELERLTDQSGNFADQDDISRLRLANGEPIPRLRQVLDLYWGKMPLNIEIKSIGNLQGLLGLLAGYPSPGAAAGLPWILISAFNHDTLAELRRLGCPWPLAPLNRKPPAQTRDTIDAIAPYSWHFANDHVDLELVRDLRDRGILSLVFTVNDTDRARFLRAHGIAGIFTDQPARMLQMD